MQPLRVGVIGLGIGKRHLQSLATMPDVTIAGVCDIVEEAAKQQAEQYGATAYTDAEAMIATGGFDAVTICTPPRLHRPLTEAAARYGTHVLCEKPMAPSLADCDAMVEACRDAEVCLMIAQKMRFHPLVQRMKELAGGEFGSIRWAVAKYALGRVGYDWFWQEEDGGGPLLENSVHTIDMVRYLIGEVQTVFAAGGNLFNPDRAPQIDVAAATLQFANGAVAALGVGQASEWEWADEHFFFACERGEVRITGGFDRPTNWWSARRGDGSSAKEEVVPVDDCFDREISHFLECVRTGQTPLVTGEDARQSIAACLAIKQSIRTGQPVRL